MSCPLCGGCETQTQGGVWCDTRGCPNSYGGSGWLRPRIPLTPQQKLKRQIQRGRSRRKRKPVEVRWQVYLDRGEEEPFILEMSESEMRVLVPILHNHGVPHTVNEVAPASEVMRAA